MWTNSRWDEYISPLALENSNLGQKYAIQVLVTSREPEAQLRQAGITLENAQETWQGLPIITLLFLSVSFEGGEEQGSSTLAGKYWASI